MNSTLVQSSSKWTVGIFLAALCLPPVRAELVTHLFTDWYGVEAGAVVIKVNRSVLDAESLDTLEQVKDYYKIGFADGESPPEQVSVPFGVKLRAEVATKSEPWMIPDRPWETGGMSLVKVVHYDGLYRVWYMASAKGEPAKWKVVVLPNGRKKLGGGGTSGGGGLAYMESKDAVNWVKPSLGLVEFRGSKDNNLIIGPGGGSIFLDRGAPPAERYKAVYKKRIRDFHPEAKEDGPALEGAVSPDGIHWTILPAPISDWKGAPLANDGHAEVHCDDVTGRYVLYTRANYPRRRSIARASTADFRMWRDLPEIILTPGPDEDPSVDFYDHPYLYYPGSASTHLMLVSSFHRDTSRVDMRLGSSMDGSAWNWLSPRSVVELGKLGDWDGGQLYAYGDMVQLPDGRIAVGMIGYSDRHEDVWRSRFEPGFNSQERVVWALWEDGRIAGVEAEKLGEFTTLPLKATGQPIEINARTGNSGAGSVQVDVVIDVAGGQPQVVLRSRLMIGDLRWHKLEFAEGQLADLAGKTIRLRFQLYDAKVFGVRGDGLEWVSSYGRK